VDKCRKSGLFDFDVHVTEIINYQLKLVMWGVSNVPAVSKAFKTLENEEGYKRCQEIVEEAKSRVDESVSLCPLVAIDNRCITVLNFVK